MTAPSAATQNGVRIAVVVPSYGRPESLAPCLEALAGQIRRPDDVVVVAREDDAPTRALIEEVKKQARIPLREELVSVPGQVGALSAGCEAAHADLVAITDDDAAPHPGWLESIQTHFADPGVAGVGGRDVIAALADEPLETEVGRVHWNGKVIGNHHRGRGSARDVDVLKGVNMAFRKRALSEHGFDARLRGDGAQVHNDLKLSLAIRGSGGRLVYDPAVTVEHRPAERPQGDARQEFSHDRQVDAVHNETLALLEYLPWHRRAVFALWAVAVGRGSSPGLVHCAFTSLRGTREHSWRRFFATLQGRWAGWSTFRGGTPGATG